MSIKREKVREYLYENVGHMIEGSIDSVIARLKEFKKDYADEDNLRIVTSGMTDNGYSHHLICDRLETDAEYDMRVKREETYKDHRRKQYENLKKEFEA